MSKRIKFVRWNSRSMYSLYIKPVLSKFLAVLSSVLANDIGAQPDDLAYALGLLFFVFAVMQIPVGWGLDRFGPQIVSAVLLFIGGGGGAFLFASAQNPNHINLSMALLGIGCSPILMASYYIFARIYSPRGLCNACSNIPWDWVFGYFNRGISPYIFC